VVDEMGRRGRPGRRKVVRWVAALRAVRTLVKGRGGGTLVVAHRISSAHRARRVLVMDGEATVLGTHDELLDRSPLYRDLVGHWFAHDLATVDRLAYRP
jgi:ATP-binding cassette subfamily C protein